MATKRIAICGSIKHDEWRMPNDERMRNDKCETQAMLFE